MLHKSIFTLNIIIKHAEFVSVFLQKPEGIVITKVFKLDQSVLTIPSKMILKQQYNDNSTQWINKELTSLILTDSNFFHHVHIQRNGIFFCKKKKVLNRLIYLLLTASINSSMKSSYTFPVALFWRSPMYNGSFSKACQKML